jgi:hypothetical protein
MSGKGTAFRFVAAASALALACCGCSGAAASPSITAPGATESPAVSTPASTVPSSGAALSPRATPTDSGPNLVVLATNAAGGEELWLLTAGGTWQDAGVVPGATALGRSATGIAIASGHRVEVRSSSDLSHAAGTTLLKWPHAAPAAPVVGLDATDPTLAFVTSDQTSLAYATAAGDGAVTPVTPAPTQSFLPLVARLDSTRLVVMTVDSGQVSRLAVIDAAKHTITTSAGFGGVRDFALSADRTTIAIATASGAYVGPVSSLLAGANPEQVAPVPAAAVVWGLALDSNGSRLYMLSGIVGADGTVGAVHEQGYSRQGSGWTESLNEATPFPSAVDQVCLR